jgi:TolB-like protein
LICTIIGKGVRYVGAVRRRQSGCGPVIPAAAPRLSIVVLPFANLSNDSGLERFADGMIADLTTDLSRISGSLVTAR